MSESQILIRGAYFRHCVMQDEEAGAFIRANMTADLSTPVCEEMGWSIGKGGEDGKLKGRLDARSMILTPVDTQLQQHELQSVCGEVGDFEWFEVKDQGNQSARWELRFKVRFPIEAAAFIANYKQRVGHEPS